MIKQSVTLQDVVTLLNEAVNLDAKALTALIDYRVPATNNLCNHPTIQATSDSVGLLGLINGFFGVFDEGKLKNYGPIYANYDEDEDGNDIIVNFGINNNE